MTQKDNPSMQVEAFFRLCQTDWVQQLSSFEAIPWRQDHHQSDHHQGIIYSLEQGDTFEKGAINFSRTSGSELSASALAKQNPELASQPFQALNLSMILHPRNPHVPIIHANLRFFQTLGNPSTWWFGAAMDLNPCYGYLEDCQHWHRTCRAACHGFGEDLYPRLKGACDNYFYLPHRQEHRGIGGLWLEHHTASDILSGFALVSSIGKHIMPGYLPILRRRNQMQYSQNQRDFQAYRRGRYVEFNLLCDRGTQYGLRSHRRTEAVLVSMPPLCHWRYDYRPIAGSPEAKLCEEFLVARDWLSLELESSNTYS